MYTLTYESKERSSVSNQEIQELLEKSRKKNEENNITGCLVYYLGKFVQILEGDKAIVLALYEKIKHDARHIEVHLFSEDAIVDRTFPNWGMAYYPIDETSFSATELEQFKRNLLLLADLTTPKNITAKLFWKRVKYYLEHTEA